MAGSTRFNTRRRIAASILASLLLCGAAWSLMRSPPTAAPVSLTIAVPIQVAAASIYVAEERQLFPQQGVNVRLLPFFLGKQALQAVLDGKAEMALVADTPFMLAVLRGEQVATLATVFESRKTMAIFARKDSGITGAAALGRRRVGTVAGTNAEYFLDTMLDIHGVPRQQVDIRAYKSEQLVAALTAGEVDAVTVWHPDLARLEQQFGAAGLTIYGEDFFIYRFLLVGKKSYIDSHPVEVGRLLAALEASNALIRADPARARMLLGQRLGMAPALLDRSFDPGDFTVALDQPLLLALSNQARWAAQKQLAQPELIPDFLDFVSSAPLTALTPSANKIIR